MPIPKNILWVTFDVYGTLVDWDSGVADAFEREAKRDGFSLPPRDELIALFHEVTEQVESGSYELYAEVLRRTAMEMAKRMDWELESSRAGFLPASIERWKPFKETMPVLKRAKAATQIGLVSNVDDKLLGHTRRHMPIDMDIVVTAQQVRSYKPDPSHFTESARRMGSKKGWVHVATSYYHDVEPCLKAKVPIVWVNKTGQALEPGQKKPTVEVKTLAEAADVLGFPKK